MCLFLPPSIPLVQAKSPARLLDCLAYGVPVLTLDVGEYGRLIRDVGLHPAQDEAHITQLLIQALTDPQIRGRWSQEVFAGINALRWEHRAASLEAFLQDLLHQRQNGS